MKKFLCIILIIIIAIFLFFYFSHSNNKSDNNNITNTNNTTNNSNNSNNSNTNSTEQNNLDISRISQNQTVNEINPSTTEEEISKFSTKIYTKDSSRQNNLSITCSALNGHVVKSHETFSFTQTIGPSTSSKGYQEADIFDSNGNKKKGFGGGNCQVSSTLYNAVLNTSGLTVVERHEHSNKVPYVPTGKDAAVAYGSVDFKFRNDNDFDIKINSSTDGNNVYITLLKIQ